ncbi:MAG TPA: response regulator, partial [Anaerolineae bacterium]|nr:response regulator [Anaerolineae bacterium]
MPNEKILIVDDEKDVLDLCKRILQTQGYEVKTANNGFEAVEVAKHERFDLLLTDIKMPGITGLEIAQVLKDQDPDLICVTMTGFSTMDMAISAVKLGINEFILKPFTPRELSDSVTRALEKERLRQENFRLKSLIPLFELNKSLLSTVEVDQVFRRLLEIASKETKAQLALLFSLGPNQQLVPHGGNSLISSEQQSAAATLAQQAVSAGQQLIIDLREVTDTQRSLLMQFAATSAIATPLNPKKTCLGALVVACRNGSFAPGDN